MHKTLKLDKLEGFDYKYDNSCSTFQSKDPNRAFFAASFFFLRFGRKFIATNSSVLIKNLIIVSIKSSPKIAKESIFGLKSKVFLFWDKTLHVNKFENAGFKYDISFSKLQPKIPN